MEENWRGQSYTAAAPSRLRTYTSDGSAGLAPEAQHQRVNASRRQRCPSPREENRPDSSSPQHRPPPLLRSRAGLCLGASVAGRPGVPGEDLRGNSGSGFGLCPRPPEPEAQLTWRRGQQRRTGALQRGRGSSGPVVASGTRVVRGRRVEQRPPRAAERQGSSQGRAP